MLQQPWQARTVPHDLGLAERELRSLLRKCEAVLDRDTPLSPSRQTLMTNRVAALRTALALVAEAQGQSSEAPSESTFSSARDGR